MLLLAAHFDVPVCPHAGGVGPLPARPALLGLRLRLGQRALEGRRIEYAAHLHEHFVTPLDVRGGRYHLPSSPGFGVEMKRESLERFAFPGGARVERAGAR